MRLTNIAVRNWLSYAGVAAFDLAPLTVVAGPNGAGKTALRDAVSFALQADLGRAPSKGQRTALITEGQESGLVGVTCAGSDGQSVTLSRNVADAKPVKPQAIPYGAGAALEAVPYVLDQARFAGDDAAARQTLLRRIMGAELGPEAILTLLTERGHPDWLVAQLRARMPDTWTKHCETSASEARGAWKALTGTTYGPEKASGYVVPGPAAVEAGAVLATEKRALAAQDATADLHRKLGALDAATETGQRKARHWQALTERAALEPSAAADVAARKRELCEAIAQREKDAVALAAMQAGAAEVLTCPACGVCLGLAASEDEQHSILVEQPAPTGGATPAQIATASAELKAFDATVRALSSAHSSAKVRHEQAVAAQEELARTLPPAEVAVDPDARAKLEASLAQARVEQDASLEALRQAREATAAFADAARRTELAAKEHAAVLAWTAAKAALAPDGLPSEVMGRALGPFNDMLRDMAGETGWRQVAVRPDMSIDVGGRPYWLLSESERWRADVMLTMVVAICSELRFAVFDEFDLLDVPSRAPALRWFFGLTQSGDMDTLLVLGTMKARPQAPAAVKVHWLGADAADERVAA